MKVRALKDCSYNFLGYGSNVVNFKKNEIYDLDEKKALMLIDFKYVEKADPKPEVEEKAADLSEKENKMMDVSAQENKADEKPKRGRKSKK